MAHAISSLITIQLVASLLFFLVAPRGSKAFPSCTAAAAVTRTQMGATTLRRDFGSSFRHEKGTANRGHCNNQRMLSPRVPQCRPACSPHSLLLLLAGKRNDINGHGDQHHEDKSSKENSSLLSSTVHDLLSLMRPWTLCQAVGAWMVGRLVVLQSTHAAKMNLGAEIWALWSVYLSYGVGMVANDCADAHLDASHRPFQSHNHLDKHINNKKSQRAIASGRISVRQGWCFVAALTMAVLIPSYLFVSNQFTWWTLSNLVIMLAYAGGLQKLLLVKNILVGWLCISPLWGAKTMAPLVLHSTAFQTKMKVLAMTGFALGTLREILKDCQDVDLDRGTKRTLPMVLGVEAARRLCMGALGITLAAAQSPLFRQLFAKGARFPIYSMAWWVAVVWSLRATWRLRDSSAAAIDKQQSLVKQSIYVLLLGLIGSILLQR